MVCASAAEYRETRSVEEEGAPPEAKRAKR
jgi:hypothetical protein